jgi:zinc-ribbon domain
MSNGGTMTERCLHCGHPVPEKARFCSECGALVIGANRPGSVPPSPPRAPPVAPDPPAQAPASSGAKTLLNFGAIDAGNKATAEPSPVQITAMGPHTGPQPRVEPRVEPPLSLQRTMLGVSPAPVAALVPSPPAPSPLMATVALAAAAPGPAFAPPAPAPAADPAARPPAQHKQTMMGIAMPGIAPLRERDPTPQPASPPAMVVPRHRSTTPLDFAPPPPIVPAPDPLSEMPPPLAPRIVRTQGVPIVPVALVAVVLVVCGGGAMLWFSRGAPLTAEPRSSQEGKDALHLRCEPSSCKDGTVVTVEGARAVFAAGEADLALSQQLHIGDNPLTLDIDRPGYGRDESVKLVVPLPYRVWADVAPMSSSHPAIVVRVQAVAGSEVTLDGKRLALDAEGSGAYAIDKTPETEGPADESRVLSATVPYVIVTGAGAAQRSDKGSVSARVPVSPLRVDAPRGRVVVATDQIAIAGRAPRGASVTIDGAGAPTGPDGTFDALLPLPAMGERRVAVRAGTSTLAPRTVYLSVKRVASLIDEARAFEAQKTTGYDAAMTDLNGSVGQPIVVDGEVVESRGPVMLVDDRRGCAKGPCATRVVLSQDATVARGATVRAYGRVARAFTTPAGRTVPEVEADFVLQSRK